MYCFYWFPSIWLRSLEDSTFDIHFKRIFVQFYLCKFQIASFFLSHSTLYYSGGILLTSASEGNMWNLSRKDIEWIFFLSKPINIQTQQHIDRTYKLFASQIANKRVFFSSKFFGRVKKFSYWTHATCESSNYIMKLLSRMHLQRFEWILDFNSKWQMNKFVEMWKTWQV